MCNGDYVHIVREIMSRSGPRTASRKVLVCAVIALCLCVLAARQVFDAGAMPLKQVDRILHWYIITITYGRSRGPQASPSSPTGRPASPPRSGHRRTISGQHLFRPRRFDPGQIRNAAAGRGRTDPCQPGGARSRALAALFLSSPGCPPAGRFGRIDPAKARTARSPQVNGFGAGLPRPTTHQPTQSAIPRIGTAGQRKNGRDGSPTHHRTGVIPTSKKTPLKESPRRGSLTRKSCESGMSRFARGSWRELPPVSGASWPCAGVCGPG